MRIVFADGRVLIITMDHLHRVYAGDRSTYPSGHHNIPFDAAELYATIESALAHGAAVEPLP